MNELENVARVFNMTVEDLKSRKRDPGTARARHVAMYLLWREDTTMAEVGHILGDRSPAAVCHGVQVISRGVSKDSGLKRLVDRCQPTFKVNPVMEAEDIDRLIRYHQNGLDQYRQHISPDAQSLEELTIKALEALKRTV